MIDWERRADRWVERREGPGFRYCVKPIGKRWCATITEWQVGALQLPRTLACFPNPAEAKAFCQQHLEARHAPV
jgi:hypothetical protein